MPTSARARVLAVLEILAAFAIAALVFWGISLLPLPQEEAGLSVWGLSFPEYGAVLLLVLGALVLVRRNLAAYGLCFRPIGYHLAVTAIGVVPVLTLSVSLAMLDWGRLPGALLVAVIAVAGLVLLAWMLRKRPTLGEQDLTLSGLALLPLLLTLRQGLQVDTILLKMAYFYLLVGPAEELLFRGYIQSRLNQAFGRPRRFFGVPWGWGLVISSLLFGLWHVVFRPTDPTAWLHGLWTTFAGLLFGYLREKTASLVAPTLLHGVLNYVPFVDLFAL